MKNCLLQIFEDEKMITQRKVMILLKMFKHVCDAAEYEKYHVGSPNSKCTQRNKAYCFHCPITFFLRLKCLSPS